MHCRLLLMFLSHRVKSAMLQRVLLAKIKTGYLMKTMFLHVLLRRILIHNNRLQCRSTLESMGTAGYAAASKLARIYLLVLYSSFSSLTL
ncbi:uncharacterized protein F5147DRAFT_675486 [Suillus discolor]|uniref:Secreted protein n=1 Tax=Suillus discolor TaxID=1912936 RepID=A0A9P7JXX7_9AGAM|nr:uncharacterized protein F5147DRAFT_675486 [Suillus discolor]KAG2115959.1 hypothetical protein F5147DRAFT_675486 [Suillus discolor]